MTIDELAKRHCSCDLLNGYTCSIHDDARAVKATLMIDTPEIEDFLNGTRLEARHQIERWGDAHDRSKSAENWYWLVGYLAGKALRSAIAGDRDKALHHCISSAAALLNWHSAIRRDTSGNGSGSDLDMHQSALTR